MDSSDYFFGTFIAVLVLLFLAVGFFGIKASIAEEAKRKEGLWLISQKLEMPIKKEQFDLISSQKQLEMIIIEVSPKEEQK